MTSTIKKSEHSAKAPEVSRPLKIDGIPRAGIDERVVAKPAEREALVKRLKVLNIKRFEANLTVGHEQGGMLSVMGGVYAELTQECVVTLEPVEQTVCESFDLLLAPDYILKKRKNAPAGEYSETELPEPIEGNVLDLGEIAVQYLAMALDPYPRKKGAVWAFEDKANESNEVELARSRNPFLKLVKNKE